MTDTQRLKEPGSNCVLKANFVRVTPYYESTYHATASSKVVNSLSLMIATKRLSEG